MPKRRSGPSNFSQGITDNQAVMVNRPGRDVYNVCNQGERLTPTDVYGRCGSSIRFRSTPLEPGRACKLIWSCKASQHGIGVAAVESRQSMGKCGLNRTTKTVAGLDVAYTSEAAYLNAGP